MKIARAVFSAVCLPVLLSGCWWNGVPSNGVLVRIDSVDVAQVQAGHPNECAVNGVVVNNSKNKIENIAFDLGGVHFQTGTVHAGAQSAEIVLASVDLGNGGNASCADVARKVVADTAVPALDCTMTDVPEGDCQHLTVVSVKMSNDDVKKIQDLEQAEIFLDQQAARLQKLPLPQALGELEKGDDNIIADFVIRTDAQNWAVNRYDEGSAHVTKKTAAQGATILHAEYDYVGNQTGWVNITLYDDKSKIPCVEFWDFAGSCRDLRIPDTMKPAEAPAESAETPDSTPDSGQAQAPAAAPADTDPAPAMAPAPETAPPAPDPDPADAPR
jgi:hypothetical protein